METRSLLTIGGILVAIFLFFVKSYKDDLKEQSSREYLVKKLRSPTSQYAYRVAVERALVWTNAFFFGPRPFSFYAFAAQFEIGIQCGFWVFFVSWVFGSSGTLGSAQLLPHETPYLHRYIALVSFLVILAMPLWLGKSFWKRVYLNKQARAIVLRQVGRLPDRKRMPLPAPFWSEAVVYVAVASLLTAFVIFSVRESPAMTFAFPVYASLVILSAALPCSSPRQTAVEWEMFVIGSVATTALTLAGAGGNFLMLSASESTLPYIVSLWFLSFLLPMAYAVPGFLAWGIARALAKKLVGDLSIFTILVQVAFNFVAAVVCIAVGVVLSISLVDFANGALKLQRGISYIDIGNIISAIGTAPNYRDIAWLLGPTLMTLIPVLFHLVLLLAGLFTVAIPKFVRIALAKRIERSASGAELMVPALVLASMPWLAVASLLALTAILYWSIEAVHARAVVESVRLAGEVHNIVLLHQKAIGATGLLVLLFLLLPLRRAKYVLTTQVRNASSPAASQSKYSKQRRKRAVREGKQKRPPAR